MNSEIDAVRQFQEKVKVSETQRLTEIGDSPAAELYLDTAGSMLKSLSRRLELMLPLFSDDRRILRAHLMMEELGELLEAMANYDEVGTLDALADLTYVVFGSAVTMDLPLYEAFWEVHRSNMTKEKQPDDPNKDRVRSKGPNYAPADLKGVLERCRR
jgi:hypothetical protein